MENSKPTKEEIFDNKRTDKVYVSPQFTEKNYSKDLTEEIRPIRKINKIITASEEHGNGIAAGYQNIKLSVGLSWYNQIILNTPLHYKSISKYFFLVKQIFSYICTV